MIVASSNSSSLYALSMVDHEILIILIPVKNLSGLMGEAEKNKPLRMVRLGGYLIILGILLGIAIGVLAVVNPWFSSRFVGISQYEAIGFFLGVNLPTSVITVALGYIFATTMRLDGSNGWRSVYLSILSLVCLVTSALSVFNFFSFLGGFLVLIGVILAYSEPTFQALSGREASFLAETGALLVASSSTLFLFMWLVAESLPTYLMGAWRFGFLYPSAFLTMAIGAFLMFLLIPLLGLRSAHPGACGFLSLILLILISLIAVQLQFVYLNLSGYLGFFMLIVGIASALFGALINIRIFFSVTAELKIPETSPSFQRYCAYCGRVLGKSPGYQKFCSQCGRRPTWKSGAPFCPYCGRVVPKDAYVCPHCQERLD